MSSAAVSSGVRRRVVVSDWKLYEKNTLKGFFTVTLPSGLILHGLMYHERDGKRWVSFPAKEYLDTAGQKQYARFIEFVDRESSDRFRDLVLDALDEVRT